MLGYTRLYYGYSMEVWKKVPILGYSMEVWNGPQGQISRLTWLTSYILKYAGQKFYHGRPGFNKTTCNPKFIVVTYA